MSEVQFARMRKRLQEIFPQATVGEISHGCNLISNELRKCRSDIYEVELSGHSMAGEGFGHYEHFEVTFGNGQYLVHGRITVD